MHLDVLAKNSEKYEAFLFNFDKGIREYFKTAKKLVFCLFATPFSFNKCIFQSVYRVASRHSTQI